jgi:hypothetical protein
VTGARALLSLLAFFGRVAVSLALLLLIAAIVGLVRKRRRRRASGPPPPERCWLSPDEQLEFEEIVAGLRGGDDAAA